MTLDERIKSVLGEYEKLKRDVGSGKVSKEEFNKKRDALIRKITPRIDEKLDYLQGEKDGLVFAMNDLEDLLVKRKIKKEAYDAKHRKLQEKILEIDDEMKVLRGGRKNIDTLGVKQKQIAVTKTHVVILISSTFFVFLMLMLMLSGITPADITHSVLDFMSEPFKKPDLSSLASEAKKMSAGALSGLEKTSGFSGVKPIPGKTSLTNGVFNSVFTKPSMQIEITSVYVANGATLESCKGVSKVNGFNLTTPVGVSNSEMEFNVEVDGCPQFTRGEGGINVTVGYYTVLGDSKTHHLSTGEITLY